MSILFHEYELLAKSKLFDAEYYLSSNPELAESNIDPLMHYLETGCRQGLNPSADFDTVHYRAQCDLLGEVPSNALVHYLTVGMKQGLTPRRLKGSLPPGISPETATDAAQSPAKLRQPARARPEAAQSEPTVLQAPFPGHVDTFGYTNAAAGWLFSGWIPRPFSTAQSGEVEVTAQFEQSQLNAMATLAFYQRDDLDQKAVGLVVFLPGPSRVLGKLQSLSFCLDEVRFVAHTGNSTARRADQELVESVRANLLHRGFAQRNRDVLLSITGRRGYSGQDTLTALSEPVLLEIDDAILCPPNAVLIKGWHLAALGTVRKMRVRSGPSAAEIPLEDGISIARPDVIAAVGTKLGFTNPDCGFMVYVPESIIPGETTYIEIELTNGEVGYRSLQISKRTGLDAIRRILEVVDARYGELNPVFDKVLGPAITNLNAARLKEPVIPVEIIFGTPPSNPLCSLIIPLYGRVDFVEYQLALFSRAGGMNKIEIIYVLDDPSKRRELESLAQSSYERFGIAFRLLMLPRNLGFAPANNVGLRSAHGMYVCFLNSDIFPITKLWLHRLVERLRTNSDIGIIGARLLFEDGSIQHEGCYFRPIAELGNWQFVEHQNKGLRPSKIAGVAHHEAITGACMVIKRSLVRDLGGFDEAYVVGDFEDSDLCRKIIARGLRCSVDNEVELYHLERKSQASPNQNWRMNLTLYNAWVHQRRWGTTLAAKAAARPESSNAAAR